jgi:cytochrome c oxidase subunit 2
MEGRIMGPFQLFPDQASTFAGEIDLLYIVLILLSAAFAVPIVILLFYFSIKYRRSADVDRARPFVSTKLEIAWIVIPLILAMAVFAWAASLYFNLFRPPSNTLDLSVVGKQWMWYVQHPDGQREINELHVPVGQPVKLTMISQDVIHSFYVPAFRVKHDVLPGRYTIVWFEATKTGEYHLFCAEYCGAQHSGMIGRVVVMEPTEYEAWLSGATAVAGPAPQQSLAQAGAQLFQQLGCSGCHVMDGSGPGPSLAGIFGQPVPLESEETVIADENYIRESIYFPNRRIVAGYEAIMPSYEGQISEEEVLQIVEYIKSLGAAEETDGTATTPDAGGPEASPASEATPETDGAAASPETQRTGD